MGRSIHRNGDHYREWSSICDQYVTPPMTRAEMAAHLAETTDDRRDGTPARIEERLARADAQGTSAHRGARDATTWETERCDRCATFHHAYTTQRGDVMCADCGETEGYIAHHPPCVVVQTPAAPATPAPVPADNPATKAAGLVQINVGIKDAAALTAAIEAFRTSGARVLELPPGAEVQLLELRALP